MEDELKDSELVYAVQAGDTARFDLLVKRHQRMVFNCALGVTRSREDAGDVTQDVFLRFFRNIDQFDPERALAPYLLKIALNCSRTLLRKRSHEYLSEDMELSLPSQEPCHSEVLDRKHNSEMIRSLINSLPLKLREVCTLYYLSECTCAQVAGILGMNENYVKVSLHRVRRKLLDALDREGFCYG